MSSLLLTAPPAAEPVSLAEAKAHLRVDGDADDTQIESLIVAARQSCETFTGRALITQGWRLWLDAPSQSASPWWDGMIDAPANCFDVRAIPLPRAPLQTVTAITSFDSENNATALSAGNYHIDNASQPGRVVLKDGANWPSVIRRVQAVRVDYTAGYGDTANDVPMALRQGILLHVAQLYANRGDVSDGDVGLPLAARALYQPYRLLKVI